MKRHKIYIASPLGFSEFGLVLYRDELLPALAEAQFEALDPWADQDGSRREALVVAETINDVTARREALRQLNERIGADNASKLRSADGVLAILDGTDVDSGTASEIGFAVALGKVVVGLRTDRRWSGDNEGTRVNLQVRFFVEASGGTIVEGELSEALVQLRERLEGTA